jgi:hypothetical protein
MNKNKIYNISKVVFLVIFGLCLKSLNSDAEHNYCWVGLALAGAGIASSLLGRKKSKAEKPPAPVDIFSSGIANQQAGGLLRYYRRNVPGFIGLQNKFGPQLIAQSLGQGQQYLQGVNGQMGLFGLSRMAGEETGQTLTDLRAAELAQQTGQTGLTRGLMAALSPEQAAVVQASAQEAERARASAQGVTPEEQRMYQQTAREAAQASGRLGGNSAIAAEVMGRENVMAAKRAEAAQAGQRAYSQAGEFYTNPGLQALRSAPQSYTAGMGALGIGLTSGPASSGQFDYNMPLGFAQQAAGAQNQYNQAVYQTNLANQQAKSQMWSGIGSSLLGAGLGGMGGVSGGNFSSFLGGGNLGNAGTAFGNMFRESAGQPLRAYTV